jgi:hypothetical protein
MTLVSRFEADLLRLLHALLGRAPIEGVVSILEARRDRPACLGRPTLGLIGDALVKGYVHRLARLGGWHRDRFLRDGRAVSGRLWERSEPEALAPRFSGQALRFLLALACDRPGDPVPGLRAGAMTVADRVFVVLAYESLRSTSFAGDVLRLPALRSHGLARLAFPDDFAESAVVDPPEMAPWASGPGAEVVEAMMPLLAARWAEVERSKARIADPGRMEALVRSQALARDAFLDAIDASGRRDLGRLFLDAASAVLVPGRRAGDWFNEGLTRNLGLAERTRLQRSALVLVDALDRLRAWDREARAVGYFDEGYAAAQLAKSEWEARGGDDLVARADALRRELDPLGL